ncbi:thiaminase II [Caedibacter taeniospiralis]|jgi:thiaminase/transcriptional activator TenA|uniref:thiaminase II n=1 Tax=Caedibacter taeniospiralis TaxID=28907 RepID=UPI0037BEF312
MTKLSETALEKCGFIIQAIKEHPFNKELTNGSLNIEKFAYYIEQDTLYLRDFARSLAVIASKAPLKFVKDFLSFSDGALIAEQEVVHSFFRQTFNLQETGKLTPAILSYTSYLLQVSSMAPVEIAIASVLPCFWVYKIVGQSIAQNTDMKSQNPYKKWIETYSGQDFSDSVERVISIFDEVALSASDEVRYLMLDAFYKSTVLEWHFWNDSYNQTIFDIVT